MSNIGILLIEFFELYGKSFNYKDVAVDISGYRPKRSRSIVSIIDPQDAHNDVSQGSFNYLSIKMAFQRAFMVLTSMTGAGFEAGGREREVGGADRDMVTLLGSILTVGRDVLERRMYIEKLYEDYCAGGLVLGSYGVEGVAPIEIVDLQKGKRKRDVVFVEEEEETETDESDDGCSDDMSREEYQHRGGYNKNYNSWGESRRFHY